MRRRPIGLRPRLTDERTGLIHDFRKKQGVEHSQIYAPDHAPAWAHQSALLWNAAEAKENRRNSCTAMELEFSFPAEFSPAQRREAGQALAREVVRRYECAAEISYHLPPKGGDQRNYHAHLLFTSRGFDASTKDGWNKNKYRDLSKDKITVEGKPTTRGKQEVLSLRAFTATTFNEIAERDHVPVTVDPLSFKSRGIDQEPQIHVGHKATGQQRKYEQGKTAQPAKRAQRNAQIIVFNQSRAVRLKQAREYLARKKELADIAERRAEILQEIEEAKREQKQLQEAANRKGLRGLIDTVTGEKRKTKKRLANTNAAIAEAEQTEARQDAQAEKIKAEQQRQLAEKKRQSKAQAEIKERQSQPANDAPQTIRVPKAPRTVPASPQRSQSEFDGVAQPQQGEIRVPLSPEERRERNRNKKRGLDR